MSTKMRHLLAATSRDAIFWHGLSPGCHRNCFYKIPINNSSRIVQPTSSSGCISSAGSVVLNHRTQSGRRSWHVAESLARPVCFFGSRNVEFSVVKVQVALFGDIPKYQRTLNRLAETDTSDEDGLHELLQGTASFLLNRLSNCSYALVRNKGCEDIDEAEQFFNRASMEERGKFREETLVNFDGRQRQGSLQDPGHGDMLDSWLCVTILVAIEGDVEFPKTNSLTDLKKAVETLRVLEPLDLVAVELLWTPQATGDAYTRDELLADYPTLMTLS